MVVITHFLHHFSRLESFLWYDYAIIILTKILNILLFTLQSMPVTNIFIHTVLCCTQLRSLKLSVPFSPVLPSSCLSCTLLCPDECWQHGTHFLHRSVCLNSSMQPISTQRAELFGHLFTGNGALLHILSDLVFSLDEKSSVSTRGFFLRCQHLWASEHFLFPIFHCYWEALDRNHYRLRLLVSPPTKWELATASPLHSITLSQSFKQKQNVYIYIK